MLTGLKLILVLVAAPFCIGLLPVQAMEKEKRSPAAVLVAGYLCMMALFQLLAVPVILKSSHGYELLVTVYSLALGLLAAAGLLAAFRQYSRGDGSFFLGRPEWPGRSGLILWLLFFGLLAFQLIMNFSHAPFDGDDAYYVAHSVAAQQTGTMYRILPYTGRSTSLDLRHALAPLPVWEAYLAGVTGIHATIMAHTVLQAVFTCLSYLVYYLIGRRLCRQEEQLPAFMIFMGILQLWGNTSLNTTATFFLMRTWQGKAVVGNLVIPCIFWLLLWIFDGKRERKAGLWILLFLTNTVAALCTSMGCFFAALLLGVTGLVVAACKRSWKVLLQLALTALPCVVYVLLYFVLTRG